MKEFFRSTRGFNWYIYRQGKGHFEKATYVAKYFQFKVEAYDTHSLFEWDCQIKHRNKQVAYFMEKTLEDSLNRLENEAEYMVRYGVKAQA